MIDRIVGGDAEAEAQFTALEPVGRMGSPAGRWGLGERGSTRRLPRL